jgi:hypothetical protein
MLSWYPAMRLAVATLAQWVVCIGAIRSGMPASAGFALGCALGLGHLRPGSASWTVKALRSGLFPISYCALWMSLSAPSWIWGAMAIGGAMVFPKLDRMSAPLWRSPAEVSTALGVALAHLEIDPTKVLDPGCGLGDGLTALRSALPRAEIEGIEAAWLPWLIARWRFGDTVERGDMWDKSWARYDMVYLFLRPEAMERARSKIFLEMYPDSIVASLDFEFDGVDCVDEREVKSGRILRLYKAKSLGEIERFGKDIHLRLAGQTI